MATLQRVRSVWTGFQGAPGYTDMYFGVSDPPSESAQDHVDAVADFWGALVSFIPTVVTITVEPVVIELEAEDGLIIGERTVGTAPAAVDCTASGAYAAPTGCTVQWITSTYLGGRRLRGRSYVVPLSTQAYQDNGTLYDTTRAAIEAAGEALRVDAGDMVVWHRPTDAGNDGTQALVTSVKVGDRCAILRSRRD